MSPQAQVAIDAAFAALHDLAKAENVYLGVWLGPDGRVDIYTVDHTDYCKQRWIVRADMLDGGSHPRPGAALAARARSEGREQ